MASGSEKQKRTGETTAVGDIDKRSTTTKTEDVENALHLRLENPKQPPAIPGPEPNAPPAPFPQPHFPPFSFDDASQCTPHHPCHVYIATPPATHHKRGPDGDAPINPCTPVPEHTGPATHAHARTMSSARLSGALARLRAHPDGTDASFLRASVRAAARAADEAEMASLEVTDLPARARALAGLKDARAEIAAARERLRARAADDRASLLPPKDPPSGKVGEAGGGITGAAAVANDINASLRRATGTITSELDRSRAAAGVVDAGGRTLRKTRDRQRGYAGQLGEGKDTLRDLRRAERRASGVLALSLVCFACMVVYVVRKRVGNSWTAMLVVRPAVRVARGGFGVVGAVFGRVRAGRGGLKADAGAREGEGGGSVRENGSRGGRPPDAATTIRAEAGTDAETGRRKPPNVRLENPRIGGGMPERRKLLRVRIRAGRRTRTPATCEGVGADFLVRALCPAAA